MGKKERKTIPYREGEPPPAGNFVLAQIVNERGTEVKRAWVDPGTVQPGPIQSENLNDVEPWIRWTWRHMGKYLPHCTSLEQWELGFMRELDPVQEVVYWVKATYAFLAFTRKYPVADRQVVANALTQILVGRQDRVRPAAARNELLRLLGEPPQSISDLRNITEDGYLTTGEEWLR